MSISTHPMGVEKLYVRSKLCRSPDPLLGTIDTGVGAIRLIVEFTAAERFCEVAPAGCEHDGGTAGSRTDALETVSPEAATFSAITPEPLTAIMDQAPPAQTLKILVLPIDCRAEIRF
jgi:hypothetical protein